MISFNNSPVTIEFADADNMVTIRYADGRRRVVSAHRLRGPVMEIGQAVRNGRARARAMEREWKEERL